jgi:molybdate transport system substrate-binding protein
VRLLAALLVAALLAGCGGTAGSDRVTVRVAAASDLQFAFAEVAELVAEQRPDVEVVVTYGSSGTFLQQIVNGAPYDLYLSADLSFPRQLVERGMAEQSGLFGYAAGRLVVWTPEGSSVDPSPGLSVLTDERVRRVAIANPEHAPYGVAAVAAMRTAGVEDVVAPKLVLGENIAQAAEFVQSGNADAGVVALSLVLSDPLRDVGRWVEVPTDTFPRLEQGGVVLSRATDAEAARAIRDVLLGDAGRSVLERYGFVV